MNAFGIMNAEAFCKIYTSNALALQDVLRNAWALLITKSEALCNRLSEA